MTGTATAGPNTTRGTRIPFALQAVFLASNRGKEVHKPPPDHAASKVFFRNWLFQRKSNSSKKNGFDRENDEETKEKRSWTGFAKKSAGKSRLSPQIYLDAQLSTRGYSTRRFKALQTAYHSKPTPLQEASYDVHLMGLVRAGDVESLKEIMSCGISPNPCNSFGDSLVHKICRRGDHKMLQVLVQSGCDLQVADDYGRTPLHDACWAPDPAFETVQIIMKVDLRMFHLIDARGHVPLSYVREEHWSEWISFLNEHLDIYWPKRDIAQEGHQSPPPLTEQGCNTRPLKDPDNALPLNVAKMIAAGRLTPHEAEMLHGDGDTSDDDSISSSYDDEDSEYDDDDDSDYSDDEYDKSLEDLLQTLPAVPVRTN